VEVIGKVYVLVTSLPEQVRRCPLNLGLAGPRSWYGRFRGQINRLCRGSIAVSSRT